MLQTNSLALKCHSAHVRILLGNFNGFLLRSGRVRKGQKGSSLEGSGKHSLLTSGSRQTWQWWTCQTWSRSVPARTSPGFRPAGCTGLLLSAPPGQPENTLTLNLDLDSHIAGTIIGHRLQVCYCMHLALSYFSISQEHYVIIIKMQNQKTKHTLTHTHTHTEDWSRHLERLGRY